MLKTIFVGNQFLVLLVLPEEVTDAAKDFEGSRFFVDLLHALK